MLRLRKRLGSEPAPESTAITVVLTNWKRPENLRRIVRALGRQTARPSLFLWNNGAEFSHPAMAWQVDSSVNQACWPRWWMASCAQTEFVCVLDDDLMPRDERVLDDMRDALRERPERTIAGPFGVKLHPDREYGDCTQVKPGDADQPADLVKGRFMMLRTAALAALHLRPRPTREALVGDDIFVSGVLAGRVAGQHLVPGGFVGRWKELSNDHGLFRQPDHLKHREQARRAAFSV